MSQTTIAQTTESQPNWVPPTPYDDSLSSLSSLMEIIGSDAFTHRLSQYAIPEVILEKLRSVPVHNSADADGSPRKTIVFVGQLLSMEYSDFLAKGITPDEVKEINRVMGEALGYDDIGSQNGFLYNPSVNKNSRKFISLDGDSNSEDQMLSSLRSKVAATLKKMRFLQEELETKRQVVIEKTITVDIVLPTPVLGICEQTALERQVLDTLREVFSRIVHQKLDTALLELTGESAQPKTSEVTEKPAAPTRAASVTNAFTVSCMLKDHGAFDREKANPTKLAFYSAIAAELSGTTLTTMIVNSLRGVPRAKDDTPSLYRPLNISFEVVYK